MTEMLDQCECSNISQVECLIEEGTAIVLVHHYNCIHIISFSSENSVCHNIFGIISLLRKN